MMKSTFYNIMFQSIWIKIKYAEIHLNIDETGHWNLSGYIKSYHTIYFVYKNKGSTSALKDDEPNLT